MFYCSLSSKQGKVSQIRESFSPKSPSRLSLAEPIKIFYIMSDSNQQKIHQFIINFTSANTLMKGDTKKKMQDNFQYIFEGAV